MRRLLALDAFTYKPGSAWCRFTSGTEIFEETLEKAHLVAKAQKADTVVIKGHEVHALCTHDGRFWNCRDGWLK